MGEGSFIFDTGLIQACKDEVLVIVLECVGDLSPYGTEYFLVFGLCFSCHMDILFEPATIVMIVEDDIQTVMDAIVDNLAYALHPRSIDGIHVWITGM